MFAFIRKPKPEPSPRPKAARPSAPQKGPNVVALHGVRAGTPAGTAPGAPAPQRVVSQAADLPAHSGVISGTDKASVVRVSAEQEQLFCVLRLSQRAAAMVAGPEFRALPDDQRIGAIQHVRGALSERNYELQRPILVTQEVLSGLLADRSSSTRVRGDSEVDAAKETDGGRLFETWGSYAVVEGASDIHIEIRENVVYQRFRIETELEDMRDPPPCFPAQASNAISVAYNKMMAEKTGSHSNFMSNEYQSAMIPFEHSSGKYRLRLQTLPTDDGLDIIMRVLKIDSKAYFPLSGDGGMGFESSQATQMLAAMNGDGGGLIVSSGITGSGKTTTVKSMLDHQHDKKKKKRIGVEDPKEYEIDDYTAISIQRDVGDEVASLRAYKRAYASLMRSDLDVGMVGEIRDNVSANAAVVIAESGHLAIGSNHARTMMGILPRLTSQQIGADLHALTEPGIFRLMINQALLARVCKSCGIPIHDSRFSKTLREEMMRVSDLYRVDTGKVHMRNPDGCPVCRQRGVKGMTVIAEVYAPTDEFLALMREKKTARASELWMSEWDEKFDSDNMHGKTIFEHALLKMLRGEIDPSLARDRTKRGFAAYLSATGERGRVWKR